MTPKTPQQRLEMISARIARKHARQDAGLVQSAMRMIEDHDRNNGVSWIVIAASRPEYEKAITPIVNRMITAGVPRILIPRKAATEYINSSNEG